MNKELKYSVADIAAELGISKQAVYQKINKQLLNDLQDFKVVENGKMYITQQGFEVIRESLNNNELNNGLQNFKVVERLEKEIAELKDEVKLLKEIAEKLNNRLEEQDRLSDKLLNLMDQQQKLQAMQMQQPEPEPKKIGLLTKWFG